MIDQRLICMTLNSTKERMKKLESEFNKLAEQLAFRTIEERMEKLESEFVELKKEITKEFAEIKQNVSMLRWR